MRNWAEEDLPGQKMLLKGVNSLSDAELLAIIIGTGVKDNSSLEIAKQMLGFNDNNLNKFWRSDFHLHCYNYGGQYGKRDWSSADCRFT